MELHKYKENLENNIPKLFSRIGRLINPLLLSFKNENNKLLVFYFHGLFESLNQKDLNHIDPQNNMTVNQFIDFIEYFLNHKYKFIVPEDLLGDLRSDQPYAMITFDDGYYNNMYAFEIINKYKIPAVFFLATKNVTEDKSFWWDIIYKYRAKQGKSIDTIRAEQRSLKGLKYQSIDNYILQEFGINSFKPWSDIDRPFNPGEVTSISKNPYISVGNHTHNHSILTNYTKEEINKEFLESNNILLNLTGTLPVSIAFPNGNFNKLVLEATAEAGFRYAFTINQKINLLPLDHQNPTCIDRYMANTTKIKRSGSFYRLGYEPDLLYDELKIKIKSAVKSK